MLTKDDADKFRESIIAQADDDDYEESGYVAVVIGDWAALTRYGHCSCFDTWDSIRGQDSYASDHYNDPKWDWQGTPYELCQLAVNKADPAIPERASSPEDYDYKHLMDVYDQILKYFNYNKEITGN